MEPVNLLLKDFEALKSEAMGMASWWSPNAGGREARETTGRT